MPDWVEDALPVYLKERVNPFLADEPNRTAISALVRRDPERARKLCGEAGADWEAWKPVDRVKAPEMDVATAFKPIPLDIYFMDRTPKRPLGFTWSRERTKHDIAEHDLRRFWKRAVT